MHRLIYQASHFTIFKSTTHHRADKFANRTPSSPTNGPEKTRKPLACLQSYPAPAEHQPIRLSDSLSKKSMEAIRNPIAAAKLTPSHRSKPIRTRSRSPRARSYSSSSETSFASTSSVSKQESITSLLSTLDRRCHKYGNKHPIVGSTWSRIGNYFFRACQYSRALNAFKQATACFPAGDPALAGSYSNLGAVYWASGKPDKAYPFLEKALEIYELHEITQARDPVECLTVASILYQMGLCNTLRKQYQEALTCLMKCQKIQASMLPPRHLQVGRTLDAIGKVYYFKGEYSTALQYHEEARRIKSASGETEIAIITSLLNIAAVHHATKDWNAALKNYTKAMHLQRSELDRCRSQLGEPLLARAAQEVGETMQLMGRVHREMNQEDQTILFYEEASMLYEEAGLPKDDPRIVALK